MEHSVMDEDRIFQYAAALNNAAVALMEKGDMYRAVGLLQESLARCEQGVRYRNNISSTSSVSHGTCSLDSKTGNHVLNCNETGASAQCCYASETTTSKYAAVIPTRLTILPDTYDCTENDSACFVDWRALKLDTDMLDLASEEFFLTWVITYNAAMCYHFLGLRYSSLHRPGDKKYALLKAITSYGFVHQMMANDPELQGDVWMLLVVVNNLSRAQLALGDTRSGNYCSKRLLAILMYIHEHEEMAMPRPLFEKYLSNVEGLILGEGRTAAAA